MPPFPALQDLRRDFPLHDGQDRAAKPSPTADVALLRKRVAALGAPTPMFARKAFSDWLADEG